MKIMKTTCSKKPLVAAAALALSAGLAAGCVTNRYDDGRYRSRYSEPYYYDGGHYWYGRGYPYPYYRYPHHDGDSLKHEQSEEQRELHRDQQDQDRELEREHRDERHDEKQSGTWDKDDRHDQHQEHRALERQQKDERQDLHRDQKRERQDED